MGLDPVEPGTFGWQPAGDQLKALFPLALRCKRSLIMVLDPSSHVQASMPGGVIPDQHERALAYSFELLAEPLQKVGGHLTHRSAIDEAQADFFAVCIQHPIAAQRFGIGVVLARLQFL